MLRRIIRWWRGPGSGDGFGQSLADDLRFARRFKRFRRREIAWRRPTAEEAAEIERHPVVGRFGDATIAVATLDGRRLIVRDRLWFGWPDPPEFAFFALDDDGIWAAVDFDGWPAVWTRP